MKAITIMQPNAQLLALKATRYDTRTWKTNYRGPLAIHASLEFPRAARRLCRCEPYASALLGNEDLPLGCIVAICDLAAVIPTSADEGSLFGVVNDFPESDLQFGDFSPGRFAWHFQNVRALEVPIPARGARSLWDWDETALGLFEPNSSHQPSPNMKKKSSNPNVPKLHPHQVRQGDVLIERVQSLATGAPLKKEEGRVILAHGEVTGHAHEIEVPKFASLHEIKNAMRQLGDLDDAAAMTQSGLLIERDSAVVHQEHARIPLEKGDYIVRRQREYSPEEIRNVAD